MDRTNLFVYKEPWGDSIAFLLAQRFDNGNVAYGTNITMVTTEPSIAPETKPLFYLRPDEAQRLMDDLWNCGIRPSEGAGSVGQLAATQKHLDSEMEIRRKLLDKVLKE